MIIRYAEFTCDACGENTRWKEIYRQPHEYIVCNTCDTVTPRKFLCSMGELVNASGQMYIDDMGWKQKRSAGD
jgi:hypothetical protein